MRPVLLHAASVLVCVGFGLTWAGALTSLFLGVEGPLIAGITVLALGLLLALGVGIVAAVRAWRSPFPARRHARIPRAWGERHH